MKALSKWCANNPTRVSAIAMILISWLSLVPDFPVLISGGLGTIIGIITGTVVWGAVNTVGKTVQIAEDVATAAAAQTVARLDESGIGALGELTGSGKAAVANASREAVDLVLGDHGISKGPPAHRVS